MEGPRTRCGTFSVSLCDVFMKTPRLSDDSSDCSQSQCLTPPLYAAPVGSSSTATLPARSAPNPDPEHEALLPVHERSATERRVRCTPAPGDSGSGNSGCVKTRAASPSPAVFVGGRHGAVAVAADHAADQGSRGVRRLLQQELRHDADRQARLPAGQCRLLPMPACLASRPSQAASVP